MRVFLTIAIVTMMLTSTETQGPSADDDHLPRRADLGAVVRPPTSTAPAHVVRVHETSALYRAGLRAGDDVIGIDGHRLTDGIDFDRRFAALRGGQDVRFQVSRNGTPLEITARLPALVRDRIPGAEVVYTQITNPRGFRQRAILSRPRGTSTPRPALLFVPWLSCDSVESPTGASPGVEELLYKVAAESGWVMLRVDKPGVGDSEGVCADTDLDTEIEGSRAALRWLRTHPWVDASRIVIMGHSFSGAFLPLVAKDAPVAGYIVLNSWVRTWMERLLEFERLQAEASGLAPADVSERQRKLAEFYALFLEQQRTPREVLAARPELESVWTDAPEHQYGRPARFHHQLQRINAAGAWSTVEVPTLAMWSDADLVMHRIDHERLVALVNRNRPGIAHLVVVPGGDHGLAARAADGRPMLPPMVFTTIQRFLQQVAAVAGSADRADSLGH
jgi:dienelactone hydrolase